ncbi:Spermidine/putrescine import ATP-binding protein PotA (plasmid) [Pseudoseohaeicola sp. NH-UV-7]|uniref:ABC transporter ATP-binding protein n=1 Tax=Sulfitobacter sp. TBRI5 TaxID=2989732 RepID=UPI003A6547F5
MIEINAVTKAYGTGKNRFLALDNVSVSIKQNEFFTLLGPSGCGKTTLLRTIAGFVDPTSGTVTMNGKNLLDLPPHKRPVNTVFQSYALFPHLTVAQNIGFSLEMLGKPKAEIDKTVDKMLALVQLEAFATRKPQQLSGGQQQRVALARALAPEPKVLLLDEPLSALDLKLRKEMQLELKRLQIETGITFIFVTHDQEEALTMSDRIAVMKSGTILQIGSPRAIYNHPVDRFVADFIGETNFLSGSIENSQIRLSSGELLDGEIEGRAGAVTLAVRPEQVRIGSAGDNGGLLATITDTVYFGTDTHCHMLLSDQTEIVARLQSPPSGDIGLTRGEKVRLRFEPGALQVLES